jgi:organic hydroperoxide reductase OsmC/OhrA
LGRLIATRGALELPTVTVAAGSYVELARTLHKPAHEKCFIANSMNFPVECEPEIVVTG